MEFIGPEMNWPQKTIAANLLLFAPLLKWQLGKSPASNAMIRTTQAPTIFQAGVKETVLPAGAKAVVNLRLVTGDTIAGAIDRVRGVIGDAEVKIAPLPIRAGFCELQTAAAHT